MGDGIEVRFKYRGQTLRPRLPMKATAANLMHASKLRDTILDEIRHGEFNMLKHFPDYKFAEKFKQATSPDARNFKDWVDVWEKLSVRDLEFSTLKIYKRHVDAYWMPAFADKMPQEITHEVILSRLSELSVERFDETAGVLRKALSRKTQNNILIPLRGIFALICRAPDAPPDPTEGIDNLKVQSGNPDPFSIEEVDLALKRIRTFDHGDIYADYFEFAAFAGLRVSEQIALTWSDVDLRTSSVRVCRTKVMTKKKERTKTFVERDVELNSRAAAALERQRARTQLRNAEIFINPVTNLPWNDDQFQGRFWAKVLRLCGIRHRPPKELRDSSVTFALQAGADPYYVSRQHGHSLQVMLKDYAKFIPDADRGRNRDAINRQIGLPAAEKKAANE